MLIYVAGILVAWLSIAQASMGPRLGGSSILGASLVGLPLSRGWVEVPAALRLRFCINMKPSLSTLSFRVAGGTKVAYRELRFPAISNYRGRYIYTSSARLRCLLQSG